MLTHESCHAKLCRAYERIFEDVIALNQRNIKHNKDERL